MIGLAKDIGKAVQKEYHHSIFNIKSSIQKELSKPVELFQLHPTNSYVAHEKFLGDIRENIFDELKGVKVVWAPPGYGKSTYLKRVCADLQRDELIYGAKIMSHFRKHKDMPLIETLAIGIGFPPDIAPRFHTLSEIMHDKTDLPIVIVFDQFDHLMAQELDHAKSFVVSLAEDSLQSKKYTVLLNVTEPKFAREILNWNGGQKISLFQDNVERLEEYKWGVEHHNQLWRLSAENYKMQVRPEIKEKFIEMCARAGTPGFFLKYRKQLEILDSGSNVSEKIEKIEKDAEEYQNKWKNGIRMLA